MKNLYFIKQIVLFLLIIIIIGAVVLSINPKKEHVIVQDTIPTTVETNSTTNTAPTSINMCYYYSKLAASGYYDVAWLKLNITGEKGEKVTGEFNNLPAEKDSKVGTFNGTVGPLDQSIMARHADVWWNSMAEGMNVKEQLIFQFGDGSATVGFGEMVDKGDGVYVYKDKTKLTYIPSLSQIDCQTLNEKLFVEKYIRDNIKTLATNQPVLGGSWYVISVSATPITHTAEVTYEDGHIQSKATLTYIYQENPQSITVTKFEVKK